MNKVAKNKSLWRCQTKDENIFYSPEQGALIFELWPVESQEYTKENIEKFRSEVINKYPEDSRKINGFLNGIKRMKAGEPVWVNPEDDYLLLISDGSWKYDGKRHLLPATAVYFGDDVEEEIQNIFSGGGLLQRSHDDKAREITEEIIKEAEESKPEKDETSVIKESKAEEKKSSGEEKKEKKPEVAKEKSSGKEKIEPAKKKSEEKPKEQTSDRKHVSKRESGKSVKEETKKKPEGKKKKAPEKEKVQAAKEKFEPEKEKKKSEAKTVETEKGKTSKEEDKEQTKIKVLSLDESKEAGEDRTVVSRPAGGLKVKRGSVRVYPLNDGEIRKILEKRDRTETEEDYQYGDIVIEVYPREEGQPERETIKTETDHALPTPREEASIALWDEDFIKDYMKLRYRSMELAKEQMDYFWKLQFGYLAMELAIIRYFTELQNKFFGE